MTDSLVKNAADPAQVKEAETKAKFGRERELEDLRFILSSKQGRRFIWRYLAMCGVFQLSYNHSGSVTFFNEGMRNIGINLMKDVTEANADAYLTMMKEAKGDSNV